MVSIHIIYFIDNGSYLQESSEFNNQANSISANFDITFEIIS